MSTPTSKRKILRGKENIPPRMESSTTPAHPSGRSAAGSRVAASYRASVQNGVLGRSSRQALQTSRESQQPPLIAPISAPEPLVLSTVPILPIVSVLGWREPRTQPLVHEDLWINGIPPPEQSAKAAYHKCGICHMVKSHPVSYLCGHSHCYVCIRMWLERRWTCPECVSPMYRPPFRHYGEEASLAAGYPEWNLKDKSSVSYSWAGLVFPEEPKILVPETP